MKPLHTKTSRILAVAATTLGLAACTHLPETQAPATQSPYAAFDLSTPPPVAARKPKDVTVHADRRIDDYFWLRSEKPSENIELLAHLKAENAYADAVLKPTAALQDALYKEMVARVQENDESVPYRRRAYWYTSKTAAGKQYSTHVRRKGALTAPDELLLDVNRLAEGKKYMSLRGMAVSPNDQLLAYSTNETGGLEGTLKVREIATQKDLPLALADVADFVWAADNKTLFYTKQDSAKRPYQLWRHVLGGNQPDQKLLEEKDELFWLSLGKSRSEGYLVAQLGSRDSSEVHVLPANDPTGQWRVVEPRRKGLEYSVEHRGDQFFILTNDTGANFRLVSTPVNAPGRANWKEITPERKDTLIEDVIAFAGHMVVLERKLGVKQLRVVNFASGAEHSVGFDESAYDLSPTSNVEFNTTLLRYSYTSLKTPDSIYDYDLNAKTRVLLKRQPVLGGYDPANYTTERMNAKAPDGTLVPISLVYRTSLRKTQGGRQAPQPLLLYGYGSYGNSNDVYFSSSRVSLLDRGAIVAFAHVRGGSDLGRKWYDDGKLAKKMNTFTDFNATAEALIASGHTKPEMLIAQGGSAGGLLMGASVNLRPDLYRAIVAEVPFVDVINTMLDESIPLTVGEFLEWGNPKVKEQYDWMRAYSPYDNLRATAYPAIYMRAGINDNQVAYWEPAKYVAKLRTLKTNPNAPVIFHVALESGHGGASGRYDALKERAQVFAFMLGSWGVMQ